MSKTLVHPSDKDGCGYYRILQPAKAIADHTSLHLVCSYQYYGPMEVADQGIDRVIVQRHTEPTMVMHLGFYKEIKVRIIHDLDDLLWQVPPTNPYVNYFKGVNRKCLKEALTMADGLTCSTPELAEQAYKFCRKRSMVLPNLLRQKHYTLPKVRNGKRLRVGWAGSNTHMGDLRIINQLVSETLDKYDWVFMGYCDEKWKSKVEFHEFVPVEKYMEKLQSLNLDVAVIPLESNLFNECKSHIKLLEFSALGIPCITTDISPYRENVNFKVPTSKRAWKDFADALEEWTNESKRLIAARNSFEWSKKYCLEQNIALLHSCWYQ